VIESPRFWEGFDVERGDENSLILADLVVLPAYVEHRPVRLLKAVAAGVPVIASSACGVENIDGIETIDVSELQHIGDLINKYI
jgi:glycosyltransferase involved in cell wall biosynthesis